MEDGAFEQVLHVFGASKRYRLKILCGDPFKWLAYAVHRTN